MSACRAGTGSSQRQGRIFEFACRAPASTARSVSGRCGDRPQGRPITEQEWRLRQPHWLPSAEDRGFVASLMRRVTEPGKVAGWIAPPEIGINNTLLDYEYVRLN
jgi:hypothetical protein